MKLTAFLLAAAALGSVAHAQPLELSDFSSFTPGYFSAGFDGPWSPETSLSGPTSFTIADFGLGTPSGSAGNAFIQWLGDTPQDWSAFSQVGLTGRTLQGNLTPTLNFYLEDAAGNSSLTPFALLDFAAGSSTHWATLDTNGLDLAHVTFWGFQVNEFDFPAPAFGFEFDNVALAATAVPVPEPAAYVFAFGGVALAGVAGWRRRRREAGEQSRG